ncbi:putative membrane protein [Clostridium sporogenes]|uniref:Putative membrane protein n=1 Tax=Clostridium sporogenes TaxID=1509 RepID=A0A1L3NME1_CLOSG|nr:putative membrane protein [Clostridium sporogenes]
MILKKSWFYIIIYAVIFLTFMYLDNSIVKQPELTWYIFLISMTFMTLTSIIAIVLSFREKRTSKGLLSED